MAEQNQNITIDQAAIAAEVEKLMQSGKLEEEYLKLRTRQKVQQKKQQGSGAMKAYQQRKKLMEKLIRERIAALGKADDLDTKAEADAAKKHEEWLAKQAEEGGEAGDQEEEEVTA